MPLAIHELEVTLKSSSLQIPSKKILAFIYKSLPKVGMKCILYTGASERGLGHGASFGRCFLGCVHCGKEKRVDRQQRAGVGPRAPGNEMSCREGSDPQEEVTMVLI